MEQDTKSDESVTPPISLTSDVSELRLKEALQNFGVQHEDGTVSFATMPFDAVLLSEDESCVVWEKDFHYIGGMNITQEIFVEYLAYLMPELYDVSCFYRKEATLAWATEGADALTLGEGASTLSETTLQIINGDITINTLWDRLHTPENVEKISAMRQGQRLQADIIVKAIMTDQKLPFAYGEL